MTLTSPSAQFVVSLSPDGRIQSRGTIDDALKQNSRLLDDAAKEALEMEKSKEVSSTEEKRGEAAGKFIIAEEVAPGHVRWPALKLYFVSMGGWFFWTVVLAGDMAASIVGALQTWYLGYWAAQYDIDPPVEVPVWK